MIINNCKLQHLDLSECGLTSEMMIAIVKAVQYSVMLLGLHFSGNPGLNEPTFTKILKKMNATYEKQLPLNSFTEYVK